MLSVEIGVERDAMCVQVIGEVSEVDVAAVGEVEHGTESISQVGVLRKRRFRFGYVRFGCVRGVRNVRQYPGQLFRENRKTGRPGGGGAGLTRWSSQTGPNSGERGRCRLNRVARLRTMAA